MNKPVDIILEGDRYPQIIVGGIKNNVLNTLLAQEAVFGWIIPGSTEALNPASNIVSFYNEANLNKKLTAFWNLVDVPKKKGLNEEYKYCETLFNATIAKKAGGKYFVSLLFKQN